VSCQGLAGHSFTAQISNEEQYSGFLLTVLSSMRMQAKSAD